MAKSSSSRVALCCVVALLLVVASACYVYWLLRGPGRRTSTSSNPASGGEREDGALPGTPKAGEEPIKDGGEATDRDEDKEVEDETSGEKL